MKKRKATEKMDIENDRGTRRRRSMRSEQCWLHGLEPANCRHETAMARERQDIDGVVTSKHSEFKELKDQAVKQLTKINLRMDFAAILTSCYPILLFTLKTNTSHSFHRYQHHSVANCVDLAHTTTLSNTVCEFLHTSPLQKRIIFFYSHSLIAVQLCFPTLKTNTSHRYWYCHLINCYFLTNIIVQGCVTSVSTFGRWSVNVILWLYDTTNLYPLWKHLL